MSYTNEDYMVDEDNSYPADTLLSHLKYLSLIIAKSFSTLMKLCSILKTQMI